jgi:hypothetical protein
MPKAIGMTHVRKAISAALAEIELVHGPLEVDQQDFAIELIDRIMARLESHKMQRTNKPGDDDGKT